MILFKYFYLFIGKYILNNNNISNELVITEKSLIKTAVDLRNITDKSNMNDIIHFLYKKKLLYTLLNININDYEKVNYIEDYFNNKNSILPFNMSAGGLYKDW
jgi:hypothetical protein